jgi:hypothetical protein
MPRVVGDSRQGRVVAVAVAACCTACAVRQRREGLPLGRGRCRRHGSVQTPLGPVSSGALPDTLAALGQTPPASTRWRSLTCTWAPAAVLEHLAATRTLVDPGEEIFPGIRAMVTPGHSPGHTSYIITSGTGTRLTGGLAKALATPAGTREGRSATQEPWARWGQNTMCCSRAARGRHRRRARLRW